MALPAGVATRALSFGRYTDAAGTLVFVGMKGVLTPSTAVVHAATGHVVTASPIPFTIGEDATAVIPGLAHCDDPSLTSLTDKPLTYAVHWPNIASSSPSPGRKTFVLLTDEPGDTTDYDTLAIPPGETGPAIPFPVSAYELAISRVGAQPGQVPVLQPDGSLVFATVSGGGGGGGSDGTEYQQTSPSASWSFTHALGRRPAVALYVAGVLVDADVTATSTQVSVVFPAPTAGTAVLT